VTTFIKSPSTPQKLAWMIMAALAAGGCGRGVSSPAELAAFRKLGPAAGEPYQAAEVKFRRLPEAYRTGTGDVLSVRLADVLRTETGLRSAESVFLCRVNEKGAIVLPIVGTVPVAGKTIVEIGAAITSMYYPRYVVRTPNVHVAINEYRSFPVSVSGAVRQPGVYNLRRDEMTLLSALMKAGGVTEAGARVIRVRRTAPAGEAQETVTLPVKWSNTPYSDVGLLPGDAIEVERLRPQHFMVVGLVKKPGAIPYPPGRQYNLAQAIAFAGGTTSMASPPYAIIYRTSATGEIRTAKVPIRGKDAAAGGALAIKPGDIVAVEHTFGTKARVFLSKLVRGGVFVGANYNFAE